MPKVSVIVPVYNAMPFLKECIESLINQTLKECEFIFVNDCSGDESAFLIEEYSRKDDRILLINHKQNQGISIARNTGLEVAKGDYIGFMDNDDYVRPDMFEVLYKNAKEKDIDIVISKTILGRDGKHIIKDPVYPANIIYGRDFIKDILIPDQLKREDLFAVWNKIYRRELVESNKLRFPNNRNIEEDNMFNLLAFNKAGSVLFLDYAGYLFREMAVSESRRFIERDYFQRAVERYYFDYKKETGITLCDSELERLKARRLIHRVFYLIFRCSTDKNEDRATRNAYIKKMAANKEVRNIVSSYTKEALEVEGHYQKLIFNIIKNQSIAKLVLLSSVIRFVYLPKLSEILRRLNTN